MARDLSMELWSLSVNSVVSRSRKFLLGSIVRYVLFYLCYSFGSLVYNILTLWVTLKNACTVYPAIFKDVEKFPWFCWVVGKQVWEKRNGVATQAANQCFCSFSSSSKFVGVFLLCRTWKKHKDDVLFPFGRKRMKHFLV